MKKCVIYINTKYAIEIFSRFNKKYNIFLYYKMPKYSSKTQSKNGGRRRKQTKRKLRRGKKSRKVMRGGALADFVYNDLIKIFDTDETQTQMNKLFQVYKVTNFADFKRKYQAGIPSERINIRGLIADIRNKNGDNELISFLETHTPQ